MCRLAVVPALLVVLFASFAIAQHGSGSGSSGGGGGSHGGGGSSSSGSSGGSSHSSSSGSSSASRSSSSSSGHASGVSGSHASGGHPGSTQSGVQVRGHQPQPKGDPAHRGPGGDIGDKPKPHPHPLPNPNHHHHVHSWFPFFHRQGIVENQGDACGPELALLQQQREAVDRMAQEQQETCRTQGPEECGRAVLAYQTESERESTMTRNMSGRCRIPARGSIGQTTANPRGKKQTKP